MSDEQKRATKAPESPDSKAGTTDRKDGPLGAGSEAAEGIHATQPQSSPPSHPESGRGDDPAGTDRAGSEPLGRQREHVSGYGGKGGAPKTSSDSRESKEPEGR